MTDTRQTLWFLSITFTFSWLCWVPAAIIAQLIAGGAAVSDDAAGLINAVAGFGAWGPLLGAVCVTAMAGGRDGLIDLWRRVVRFRIGGFWYLVVLLLFPVLIGGSLVLAMLSGEPMPELEAFAQPVGIPVAFVFILLLGGPLQEELGWRGVLQERLQARWNALTASLVVGFVWGIWHLPLFFLPREEMYYNRPIWGLVLTTVLISVLFGWVYNNTQRSIWAVLLFHTSFNWAHYLFPALGSDVAGVSLFALQALMVLVVVWWCGPKRLVRPD